MAVPDGTTSVTFAISKFLFGDTDRDGMPDRQNAWRGYGFDIDGKIWGSCTPDSLAGLCLPRDGASEKEAHAEGIDGIDNAFGRELLQILLGIENNFSQTSAIALAQGGAATVLIQIDALGTGANYTGLHARLYRTAPLGHAPAYDGTDAWPVRSDGLTNPADITSAKLETTTSYLVGNTWVGRFQGELVLEVPLSGTLVHFPVANPIVTMQLDAQHRTATNGTLAGVIVTEELVPEVFRIGSLFASSPCDATVVGIAREVAQASDILADGTQDPTKTCDGISIGLGFDAKPGGVGAVVAPEVIPPPTCLDAGF